MHERILIVVDGVSTSEPALQKGLALARMQAAEAVLLAVRPLSGAPASDLPVMGLVGSADVEPPAREHAQRRLLDLAGKRRSGTRRHAGTHPVQP